MCFYSDWGNDFNFIVTSRARCFFVSNHTRVYCLLKEKRFLFPLTDEIRSRSVAVKSLFMWQFAVRNIGFTFCLSRISTFKCENYNLYQTVLSLTDIEFNLELVHFNNSQALIAGLKGFALFWQEKVFIKFACLFTFYVKVRNLPSDSSSTWNWSCGIAIKGSL